MCSHYRPDGPSKSIPKDRNGGSDAVYVYNPADFDPCGYLPDDLKRHADCVRYFVHVLVHGVTFRKRLIKGFLCIEADIMRTFFPGHKIYTHVKNAIVESGLVLCDGIYIKGKKSLGYRLNPALAERRHVTVAIRDATLVRKIRKAKDDYRQTPEGVHRHLLHCISNLDIDYPSALEFLLSGEKFEPTDEVAISFIRDRNIYFTPDPHGRVHTNLTNLRSSLRGFLSYKGQPLINLDVRNSQPLFFGKLLIERFPEGSRPSDVADYLKLVQDGGFYERLMKVTGLTHVRRDLFKQRFFAVLYGDGERPTKLSRAMSLAFPSVDGAISEMKSGNYAALAHKLQRAESDLMISRVAVRCRDELPRAFIGTIHDSIMTTERYARRIHTIMEQEFDAIGLRVKIRAERPSRPQVLAESCTS